MYQFKRAETEDELEQVFRLNHATFTREIPQHEEQTDGRLIDRFHDKNIYFIAVEGGHVAGMISLHTSPPFSVAEKMADPSRLAEWGRLMEIRLLAVRPEHRHQTVVGGLFAKVLRYGLAGGYDSVVISGVDSQERMYRRMGFTALGPPVCSGAAAFVPMAARLETLHRRYQRSAETWQRRYSEKNDSGSG